jgi:hypothetical protein
MQRSTWLQKEQKYINTVTWAVVHYSKSTGQWWICSDRESGPELHIWYGKYSTPAEKNEYHWCTTWCRWAVEGMLNISASEVKILAFLTYSWVQFKVLLLDQFYMQLLCLLFWYSACLILCWWKLWYQIKCKQESTD